MNKQSIKNEKKFNYMNSIQTAFEMLLKQKYPEFICHSWEVLEGTNHEGQGDILVNSKIAIEVVREVGGTQKFNDEKKKAILLELFINAQNQFVQKTQNQTIWVWGSLNANPDFEYLAKNRKELAQKLVDFTTSYRTLNRCSEERREVRGRKGLIVGQ